MSRSTQIILGTGVVLLIGWLLRSHAAQAAESISPKTATGGTASSPDPNPSSPGVGDVNRTVVAGSDNLGGVVLTPGYGIPINDPDFQLTTVGKNLSTPELQ